MDIKFDLVRHVANRKARWGKIYPDGIPSDEFYGVANGLGRILQHPAITLGKDVPFWVDVICFAIDGALRTGATPEGIAAALVNREQDDLAIIAASEKATEAA